MKKRILSALLVLCLACGLVSTAWAAGEPVAAPTSLSESQTPEEKPTTDEPETGTAGAGNTEGDDLDPSGDESAIDNEFKENGEVDGSNVSGEETNPGRVGDDALSDDATGADENSGTPEENGEEQNPPANIQVQNALLLANGAGGVSTQAELDPDESFITVSKRFEGLDEDEIPENFSITVKSQKSNDEYRLTKNDESHHFSSEPDSNGDTVWTWRIDNVGADTYDVAENNAEVDGYTLETEGIDDGQVKVEAADIAINGGVETSNAVNEFDVGIQGNNNFLFVAHFSGQGAAIISKDPLPTAIKLAVSNAVSKLGQGNWGDYDDHVFYHIGNVENKVTFNIQAIGSDKEANFTYDPEKKVITIDRTKEWNKVATLYYDITEAVNGDISITNTYTPDTTTLTLTKTFDGLSDAEVEYLIFRDDGFGFDVNYCVSDARPEDPEQSGKNMTFMAPDADIKGLYLPDGTEISSLNNGGGGYRIVAGNYLVQDQWHNESEGTYDTDYTNPKTGASLKKENGNWVYSITLTVPKCDENHFFTVFEQHQEVPGYAKINDSNAEWTITGLESTPITGTGKFIEGNINVYEDMNELGEKGDYREQEDYAIAQGALRKLTITEDTTIAFTNYYTGKLDVTKTIGDGNEYGEANSKEYTLTIEPADSKKLTASNNLAGKTVQYYTTDSAQLTPVQITDGKITVQITPGDDATETIHFVDLPAIQWKVTEDENAAKVEGYSLNVTYADENNGVVNDSTHWNGYTESDNIGGSSETDQIASVDSAVYPSQNPAVDPTAVAAVTVTNTYKATTGSLTISKKVEGEVPLPENGATFTFVISTEKDMTGAEPKIGEAILHFTKAEDGTTWTSEPVTICVGGQNPGSVTITDLPFGSYTIAENTPADIGDYYCSGTDYTVETDETPIVTLNSTNDEGTIEVTNTYDHYKTVIITKQVDNGSADQIGMGDRTKLFDFTTSVNGTQITQSSHDNATLATEDDPTNETDQPTAAWTTSGYRLAHGGTLRIEKLKATDVVNFAESDYSAEGYTTSYTVTSGNNTLVTSAPTSNNNGTLDLDSDLYKEYDSLTVTFTNNRKIVAPTGLESNHTAPYTILVTVAGIAGLALIGGIVARRVRRRREE